MSVTALKSPYPYFGGKSKVADAVWSALGDVDNFVEPFFGSGAVLLMRPHEPKTETVNDLNAWLTNFWRAVQHDPDAVAKYADWPVSELDLHARGDWLFYRDGVDGWVERVRGDADFYDAKSAGWWVWGICCWIGSGWGPKENRKLPHLGDAGRGVNRKRPHLGAGRGVNRKLPRLTGWGETGINRLETESGQEILDYMRDLCERMRRVGVCCGDWSRVCGPSVTFKHGLTGVFLDPPYASEDRHECYEHNSFTVAHDVRAWCVENGGNPLVRIALCGYDGEHNELERHGWRVMAWKAKGGFDNQRRDGENNNRERERIWFSPHCLKPVAEQPVLFPETEVA